MLLLAIVAAMGAMARVYLLPRGARPVHAGVGTAVAMFWTALAVGILLKGPLILMIVGLAAAALSIFDRSARWLLALRPLPGIVWLLVLVLPWFVAIYARVGGAFLANSVGHDLLDKVAGGQESHGAPPGFYFVLFFATFFPASIARRDWRRRRSGRCAARRAARFLLAWLRAVLDRVRIGPRPSCRITCCRSIRPIAILIAGAVETKVLSQRSWLVRGVMWWFLAPIIAGIAAIIAAIVIDRSLVLAAWPLFADR